MNDPPRKPADVYREAEERGPDPRFAEDRRRTVSRIVETLALRRSARTAEKALSDWRKLAARDAARRGG